MSRDSISRNPPEKGFNLIGYATSPMGLGEDLRSFAAMLDYLGIPFSVVDVPTDVQGKVPVAWQHMTTEDYGTSVFFMAANECLKLAQANPVLFTQPSKKIGYFLWELPDFPNEDVPALMLVDHIWCPTRFVQEVFFSKSKQLTLALPLPVVQHAGTGRNFRAELNIPEVKANANAKKKASPKASSQTTTGSPNKPAFVCLFMFDLHSTMARKNPEAVIRVFLEFAKTNPDAYLILKVSRWQNMGRNALAWIPKHPQIKLIKETLKPAELSDLYQAANCYMSLHRSEGFGRTLVEALQQGLHVISTNFSGPKDFLNEHNALLVDWSRNNVLPGDYPHLQTPSWWANPNEAHALQQLHQAHQRAAQGPNLQGQKDGEAFLHKGLADKYAPILKTYLK